MAFSASDTTRTSNAAAEDTAAHTHRLSDLDRDYSLLGCLGHGGFGSVFLAKKKSGRKVALKVLPIDPDDEEEFSVFTRELEAVVSLNSNEDARNNDEEDTRDQGIIFFEDWFIGPDFACIVMNYANGGTLAGEIARKKESGGEESFFTERRIAWYALQLCEALAYAHERGVAHHDIKSSNVLIDVSRGGTLILADFGTSVAPGETSVGFTKSYASPELLASHALDDYENLRGDKIDAFGLGCILYELLACTRLEDVPGDQTLADFVNRGAGLEAVLNLDLIRLPWLPADDSNSQQAREESKLIGYSHALKSLVMTLLQPNPENRFSPSQLQDAFRKDPRSPLLLPMVSAAYRLTSGAPVTLDNIQLGMFVQRGLDWSEGESDGGQGCIGVVVGLDADAGYTEVAFPSRPSEPICCRIGAGNKFELQVGPASLPDFYTGTTIRRLNGVVFGSHEIGQTIRNECRVVGSHSESNMILVAPIEKATIPTLPSSIWNSNDTFKCVGPREPLPPPRSWEENVGVLIDVPNSSEEYKEIVEAFFSVESRGLDCKVYEVTNLQRVQNELLWKQYAKKKEEVALENWGFGNVQRFFHAMSGTRPDLSCRSHSYHDAVASLSNRRGIQLTESASYAHRNVVSPYHNAGGMQMVVARAALGRVASAATMSPLRNKYHSDVIVQENIEEVYRCRSLLQLYPEYIITYKTLVERNSAAQGRRIIHGRVPVSRNSNSNAMQSFVDGGISLSSLSITEGKGESDHAANFASGNAKGGASSTTARRASKIKECVICMVRPSQRIMIPCGHPCLCDSCCSDATLKRLRRKCPECRQKISQTAKFYGKIVDE